METTEARPFNTMKSRNSAASRAIESFFDGLSLGEIKQSGPTPGVGNGFTNSKTLGGIKDGPSPCCGNKFGFRSQRPHIRLQDEPTNHLDMPKMDALADALDEFTGAVLVCHESRLISRVCCDEEE
ncbi:hypothetical protein H0E87_027469 [Populus deltoides]|uniref:Uncharacterized protein n=1 Tax=Populus deltoides TaxID=3696 RepID=A0A8T2X0V7_POPDE|nr:hypothetical protein H0E87_027469 [Populus deltoides]